MKPARTLIHPSYHFTPDGWCRVNDDSHLAMWTKGQMCVIHGRGWYLVQVWDRTDTDTLAEKKVKGKLADAKRTAENLLKKALDGSKPTT